MDHWFSTLAAEAKSEDSAMRNLLDHGFFVIPGPVPQTHLVALARAYDQAVIQADPADVGNGRTTTRVHDFVNRGAEFDSLYLHPPVLEACCRLIEQPFKLSSMLARTLNPQQPSQKLHVDFPGDVNGWPMLGFIFMVDEFQQANGATCFLPRSQGAKSSPETTDDPVQACGPAGSMIVYNGSTWHGHGANVTERPRRSIQGAGPLAKYLLAL